MQISQNEMRIQSWRISSFGLCMTCTTCNSANRVCWYINIIIWYSSSTIVLSVINIRADNNFQSIHDFCPFCNIKCLFTGSVCTVWLGADRRKPQGTGETQTPILGHLEKPSILVVLGRLTSSECADLTSTTNHTKVLGHSNQPIWDISNEMSKDWGLGLTCALWFPPISTKSHCAHRASEQTLYVAERTKVMYWLEVIVCPNVNHT